MVRTITCPDYGLEFDKEFELSAKDAAEALLRYYTGHCYGGDAIQLQETIEEGLEKLGVSIGTF